MWRFRKILPLGPLRFSLNKHGIGVSIGKRGIHFGRTPAGQWYISFGLPGSGLYWFIPLTTRKRRR